MATTNKDENKNVYDVFISGAGPCGLLLAYQLRRMNHTVYIIDAANKASPDFPMYGRASALYSRSLEILDQMDLFDDLAQEGVCVNQAWTYDGKGKRVQGRGWQLFEQLAGKTFIEFLLNLRLKYSEDIFRARLGELGVVVQAPVRLEGFEVLDEELAGGDDDYRVRARVVDEQGGKREVRARYIVGCDGGNSLVRRTAGIPFVGERHKDHWVRIDGIVKTNIPTERTGLGAIESPTHGNVLWTAGDHGSTRIGYVLSPALQEKYRTDMNVEDVVKEAKAAVAPWELEFLEVHWHTVYGIQQHVAETFQAKERILIAGEAAHTHSSGSAQGMNTGIHDISSLSWRLSGMLNHWLHPCVLENYTTERHAIATHLINNDKIISKLLANQRPPHLEHDKRDIMILLDEAMQEQAPFIVGLGVSYAPSFLNDVEGTDPPITAKPGHFAPDALVRKPGHVSPAPPIRLHECMKQVGKFHILIFTGIINPSTTQPWLKALHTRFPSPYDHALDFLTIIPGTAIGVEEHLGCPRFGRAVWDVDQSVHRRYGVPVHLGAIVVVRPDGILGVVVGLAGWEGVERYLGRIVVGREGRGQRVDSVSGDGVVVGGRGKGLGRFMGENENSRALRMNEGGHREGGVNGV